MLSQLSFAYMYIRIVTSFKVTIFQLYIFTQMKFYWNITFWKCLGPFKILVQCVNASERDWIFCVIHWGTVKSIQCTVLCVNNRSTNIFHKFYVYYGYSESWVDNKSGWQHTFSRGLALSPNRWFRYSTMSAAILSYRDNVLIFLIWL